MKGIEEKDYDDNDAIQPDETAEPKQRSRPSPREMRRKAREDLRSKTMGVGLHISTEIDKSSKKHVVFDEDTFSSEALEVDNGVREEQHETDGTDTSSSEALESDDEVEKVKSSVARDQALKQRAGERETAANKKLKRKRKPRSKGPKIDSGDEEDFDNDFFTEVDSQLAHKRQKQQEINKKPENRHFTFVSEHEGMADRPIPVDHNIELVVLGQGEFDNGQTGAGNSESIRLTESRMGTKPSERALSISRSSLVCGDEQKKKTMNRKSGDRTERLSSQGWKRSKKMSRLVCTRSRVNRRRGRGVAAAHFVKRK